jgi:hypothetical protein
VSSPVETTFVRYCHYSEHVIDAGFEVLIGLEECEDSEGSGTNTE